MKIFFINIESVDRIKKTIKIRVYDNTCVTIEGLINSDFEAHKNFDDNIECIVCNDLLAGHYELIFNENPNYIRINKAYYGSMFFPIIL